jgi:hypothetical protein
MVAEVRGRGAIDGGPHGQLSHQRRHGRLGEVPCDQLLDLALAASARRIQHRQFVLACQVRRQDPDGGQVQRPVREHVEQDGEPPGGVGNLDPVVGAVLGQLEDLGAIREERLASGAPIQLPRIELRQVGHQRGRRLPLAARQTADLDREFFIRKMGWNVILHEPCISLARVVSGPIAFECAK